VRTDPESDQAAAVAEAGVGVLGNVPELLPARRCFGVERHGLGVVAGVLGELGAGGAEGELLERVVRRDPVGQPLGELRIARGERGPAARRQP
jgi:hypothetical protein